MPRRCRPAEGSRMLRYCRGPARLLAACRGCIGRGLIDASGRRRKWRIRDMTAPPRLATPCPCRTLRHAPPLAPCRPCWRCIAEPCHARAPVGRDALPRRWRPAGASLSPRQALAPAGLLPAHVGPCCCRNHPPTPDLGALGAPHPSPHPIPGQKSIRRRPLAQNRLKVRSARRPCATMRRAAASALACAPS